MQTKDQIIQVMKEVFDNQDIIIEDLTGPDDIMEWDSFANVNLIHAIENEFSIKFSLKELPALKNLKSIVELVETKK